MAVTAVGGSLLSPRSTGRIKRFLDGLGDDFDFVCEGR